MNIEKYDRSAVGRRGRSGPFGAVAPEWWKMELLTERDLPVTRGCVLAVGVFDGVHLGHALLLSRGKELAQEAGLPLVVYTFAGMPVKGDFITDTAEKLRLLSEHGADAVYCADFDSVCGISAADFAENTVKAGFKAECAVCGGDLRFGAGREGDTGLLKKYVSRVVTVPVCRVRGATVSSSLIRSLISAGDIKGASSLLGREYSFCFEVVRGSRLGTELGFPTANQRFPNGMCVPKRGVYSGKCVIDGVTYGCVSDIGTKPTVSQSESVICETHIFGFSGELYGKELRVFPQRFIRDELRFDDIDALKAQISSDAAAAKAVLELPDA